MYKLYSELFPCAARPLLLLQRINKENRNLETRKKSYMATGKSWLRTLINLLEVFFNSIQRSKRGRTWHQHVIPYEEGWAVRREGNQRITSKHHKQSTAIRKAKSLARKYKADVLIHRESGGIRDRISYDE